MLLRSNLRVLPLLVVFYAIMVALGSLPFGGSLLPGLAVAVVPTGLLVWNMYRKARRGFLSTVVRMSPTGVEWRDGYGFHVRLRWEAVERVGEIRTAMTRPGARVGVAGGVRMTVRSWANSGLIGWGEQRTPQNAPSWVKDLLSRAPRDPRSGASQVTIPLGGIDSSWTLGPMGGWVRRYRPDLLSDIPYL